MTFQHGPCAAPTTSCGTPSGWRRGGRCANCRTAHNRETNFHRGLTTDQRDQVLLLLRAGKTPQEAAEAIGKSATALQQSASRDGELRAALDGLPPSDQTTARKADYLCALLRSGGHQSRALESLPGKPPTNIEAWRRQEPKFAEAEEAIKAWLLQARGTPRVRIPTAALDRAAELLEQGATVSTAAKTIGTTHTGLRSAARRYPRLAAALPPITPRAPRGPQPLPDGVTERLPTLWASRATVRSIADGFGVSQATIYNWAKRLNLPPRTQD